MIGNADKICWAWGVYEWNAEKIEFITNNVHAVVYAVQVFIKNNANIKTI